MLGRRNHDHRAAKNLGGRRPKGRPHVGKRRYDNMTARSVAKATELKKCFIGKIR
jgi:hypothetical protein